VQLKASLLGRRRQFRFESREAIGEHPAVGVHENENGAFRRLNAFIARVRNTGVILPDERDWKRLAPPEHGLRRRRGASVVHKDELEIGMAFLQAEGLEASVENRPIVVNSYNDAEERRRFGCTIWFHLMIAENLTHWRRMARESRDWRVDEINASLRIA
jgi:hypothetical protein